jgi:tetratricopeptide (TPR) repeat protein
MFWASGRVGTALGRICFAALFPALLWSADEVPAELISGIQQAVQSGDLAGARARIVSALKTYPASAGLYNLKGVVEAQTGDYLLAESAFREAIRLDQRLPPAYLNLGRLYQENATRDQGAVRKAAETYLALVKIDPENAEARYQGAYMLSLEGSYQMSLSLLERLPVAYQQKAQVLAVRCADEAGLDRIVQASATVQDLAKSPELSETDVLIVQPVLAAKKQWKLETKLLESLDAKHLASASSLARLAALYQQQSRWTDARQTLEHAATVGAVTVPLLMALAQVAYKQQDFKGTLGYLAHARELDPKNGAVHFFFGMVCVDMDLPIEAEKSLAEALKLDPNNAYYSYALGAVTVQTRKWEAAIPYFEKYVQLKPEDPRGRLALATAHFHSYQDETCRKELTELVRYPQTAAGAHLYLGKLAIRENDFRTAEAELNQVLKSNPKNPDAYAELGFAYLQDEKYSLAREALTHSLEIQPEGVRANMVLLSLYQQTQDKRTKDQSARVRELIKKRDENAKALLRTIEVRPY